MQTNYEYKSIRCALDDNDYFESEFDKVLNNEDVKKNGVAC